MNKQKGFSLVEMMAVVMIMSIIASIGTIKMKKYVDKAKSFADQTEMSMVVDAIQTYEAENGSLPTNLDGLSDYLKGDYKKSHIGTSYTYSTTDRTLCLGTTCQSF